MQEYQCDVVITWSGNSMEADSVEEYKEKVFILESQYLDFKEEMALAKEEKVEEYIALRRDNPEQLVREIESKFGFEHVR